MSFIKSVRNTVLSAVATLAILSFSQEQEKVQIIDTPRLAYSNTFLSSIMKDKKDIPKMIEAERKIGISQDLSLTPISLRAYPDNGLAHSIESIIVNIKPHDQISDEKYADVIYHASKFYGIHWLAFVGASKKKDTVFSKRYASENILFDNEPTNNIIGLTEYSPIHRDYRILSPLLKNINSDKVISYYSYNEAIVDFFRFCADSDVIPSVENLATRLHMDDHQMKQLFVQNYPESFDDNGRYIVRDPSLLIKHESIEIEEIKPEIVISKVIPVTPKVYDHPLEEIIGDNNRGLEKLEKLIIVLPDESHMYLLSNGKVIRDYPCATGLRKGGKRQQGDKKTPRGRYQINYENPQSKYHFFMGINYINKFDKEMGRTGSAIGFHGINSQSKKPLRGVGYATLGCIRTTDSNIDEMLKLNFRIGTDVIIADNRLDLKRYCWGYPLNHNVQAYANATKNK